jgi:4-alpha-glucanotransferase
MISQRSSGILLHPSSLPSRGGIGDFGPAAYALVDWLAAAKQTLWQVLPLGPLGFGNSPYSCTSAFAGNTMLISAERLADQGLLDREQVESLPDGESPVDYESVSTNKLPLLREAADRFFEQPNEEFRSAYDGFCKANEKWLEDYVLFSVLREQHHDESWHLWPEGIARREPAALKEISEELAQELNRERFLQFVFFQQWCSLRSYCDARHIRIVGDVAIFVSYDSADVWTHPDIFQLREDLTPEVVSGVPPDAFSETGQRWGNPLYDWDKLKARGYDWWIDRLRWAVETCDIVRLDHFRGFEAYWEIPADEETAIDGKWVKGPNQDLFIALRNALGKLPFIAEDLGLITEEVIELRKKLDIPGMKVMQFGFNDRGAHIYLPHMYEPNSVVYTGTHDNDTTLGWWKNSATEEEKISAATYLNITREEDIAWSFVRGALTSVANLAIVPVQDVLGLDSDARMNVPSMTLGNWSWRLRKDALSVELAEKLARLVELTDRDALLRNAPVQDADAAQQASAGEQRKRKLCEQVTAQQPAPVPQSHSLPSK